MSVGAAVSLETRPSDDVATMFDLAPVSLWLEDYSGVKARLEAWRAEGVSDMRAFLREDLGRVKTCADLIRVIAVNRRTLELYEAPDAIRLFAALDDVFRDDMLEGLLEEILQLWEGAGGFRSEGANYTLTGRRIDILIDAVILPGAEDDWARLLVAIDDVTDRETARRARIEADAYARGLFDHSPVSLWVEDFSSVKRLIDDVRDCGIDDFRTFTDVHPEFVDRCMAEIRVLDVNRETLRIFRAGDRNELLRRKHEIFRDGMRRPFREQLIDLWNGRLMQQREVINYSLQGEELHFLMQFSVLPGHEHDWSLVQVALTDITARKKAEAYLEFLGKHDVLTKLHNRSFYVDEMERLQRGGPIPVTIVVADLNGLKEANDRLGHAAGDQLLRRAGEILAATVEAPASVARIGGDEFAVLMPGTDAHGAEVLMAALARLTAYNNQYYGGVALSFALGAATSRPGERLEEVARRADARMYDDKRAYYERHGR